MGMEMWLSGQGMGFVGIAMCSVTDTVTLKGQQNIQVEREPAVVWKTRPPQKQSSRGIGSGSVYPL